MAIRAFTHKGLEQLFTVGKSRLIASTIRARVLTILDALASAGKPEDLQGLRGFHPLKGNRRGEYAMSATGNWRVVFKHDGKEFYDVDLEDYH